MRKTLVAFVLTLGLASLVAAQTIPTGVVVPIKVNPVSNFIGAADTSTAIVIKYFPPKGGGSTASMTPTVAVEADGNLTFTVAGAAYTGFECPFSGALGGVLDVSDAECNTVGETVDIINSTPASFSTGYFRAAMVNAIRTDVISTQAWLADAADTEVGRPDLGESIYWDSSALDDDNVALFDTSKGASAFIGPKDLAKNPQAGINTVVQFVRAMVTNAGTVGDTTIYAVKENYITGGGCNSATDCGSGSETVRTVAVLPAVTATELVSTTYFPYFLANDERVFVRIDSSGADTTVWALNIMGFVYPNQ
jgi:hypothetical protein